MVSLKVEMMAAKMVELKDSVMVVRRETILAESMVYSMDDQKAVHLVDPTDL